MTVSAPKKQVLFLGIGFLLIGILVRKLSELPFIGLVLILLGVGLKTYYILAAVKSGIYVPGRELWLLFIGLALFLGGLYAKGKEFLVDPIYLIVIGIVLKILFIIRFIQIVRKNRNQEIV